MKRFFALLLLLVLCLSARANENQKAIDSKIEAVTVFLNGAQVTRTASTTLSPGTTHLLLGGIPAGINTQSIQVKGEGSFTVLSVVHQLNYLNGQTKPAGDQSLGNHDPEQKSPTRQRGGVRPVSHFHPERNQH